MTSEIILTDRVTSIALVSGEYLLVTATGVLRNNAPTVAIAGASVNVENLGLIFSVADAVTLSGTNTSVDIYNAGTIISENDGIRASSFGTLSVVNDGAIRAADNGIDLTGSGSSTLFLLNDGTISGATSGVYTRDVSIMQFVNTGSINGTTYGVLLDTLVGDAFVVNSGVMSGAFAFYAPTAATTAVTLVNTGTMAGTVQFGEAADVFDGRGGITTGAVKMSFGADTLYAGSGSGRFEGNEGDDLLVGSESANVMLGDANDDTLLGGAGNDFLQGGTGLDELDGGEGNDVVRGGAGADVLEGGLGRDLLDYAFSLGVNVNLATGDALFADAAGDVFTGFENIAGGSGKDTLTGDAGANALYGRSFDDLLSGGGGNDYLLGQDGNDTLDGGLGGDILRGGSGIDYFRLTAVANSPNQAGQRDRILDFVRAEGDKIDLSAIDVSGILPGDQAFTFVTGNFTNFGEVRVIASGGQWLVQGNFDATPTTVEFAFFVNSAVQPNASDFLL